MMWMEKVSDDPLVFESGYSEWLFAIGIVTLLALINAGVGAWGLTDLVSEGPGTSSMGRISFGLFYVGLLAHLFCTVWTIKQRRVVIRDGVVHCYVKRARAGPWIMEESIPSSEFDEIQMHSGWSGEGDATKSLTLKGPSHSVRFYSTYGSGREQDAHFTTTERRLRDQVSGELGNLPVVGERLGMLAAGGGVVITFLAIADVVGLLYFFVG